MQRTRIRPAADRRYMTVQRAGGPVTYEAGLVEVVNPGYDFDFRIDLRWSDDEQRLEARSVAVIARPGGPPVMGTTIREAQVGTAIIDAIGL